MSQSGQERRRVPRYPVRVGVTLVACDGSITGVHGYTIDLSSCGLRVVTDTDVRHGVEQSVLIDHPTGPIIARADILRSERRGTQWIHGMIIAQIDAADQFRLGQLCVSLA
jgi:PilZ domain